jgi:hypothetical protein
MQKIVVIHTQKIIVIFSFSLSDGVFHGKKSETKQLREEKHLSPQYLPHFCILKVTNADMKKSQPFNFKTMVGI